MKIEIKEGIWKKTNPEELKEYLKANVLWTLWISTGATLLLLADYKTATYAILIIGIVTSTLSLIARNKQLKNTK